MVRTIFGRGAIALFSVALAAHTAVAEYDAIGLAQRAAACAERDDYPCAIAAAETLLHSRRLDPRALPFQVAECSVGLEAYRQQAVLPADVRSALCEVYRLRRESAEAVRARDWYKAEQICAASLAIRRERAPQVLYPLSSSVNNLAYVLCMEGRYKEAEPLYHETVRLMERIFGRDSYQYIGRLGDWAMTLNWTGHAARSECLFQQAVDWYRKAGMTNHSSYTGLLLDFAVAGEHARDHRRTEALARQVIEIDSTLILPHWMLSAIRAQEGDGEGAVAEARRALEIARRTRADDSPAVLESLYRLAWADMINGDAAGAERSCAEALACAPVRDGTGPITKATWIHLMASCAEGQRRYAIADSLYREYFAVQRRNQEPKKKEYAGALVDYAYVLHAEGRFEKEQRAAQETLELLNDPETGQTLTADIAPHAQLRLGMSLLARGMVAAGERSLTRAAESYEGLRGRFRSGAPRSGIIYRNPYPYLAAARLALGRSAGAWAAAENGLARALDDDLLSPAALRADGRRDSLEVAVLNGQLTVDAFEAAGAAGRDSVSLAKKLAQARTCLIRVEAEAAVARASDAGTEPDVAQVLPLARIQAALDRTTVLLGWLDVEVRPDQWSSWAYLIRDSGPVRWFKLDSPSTNPDSSVPLNQALRFRLALSEGPTLFATDESRGSARELWLFRMRPLVSDLQGVEKIVVIPSGAMLGVPVEALEDESGELVGKRYCVSYAPSATIFAWLKQQAREWNPAEHASSLVLGDPAFEGDQSSQAALVAGTRGKSIEQEDGTFGDRGLVAGFDSCGMDPSDSRSSAAILQDVLRGALLGDRKDLARLPPLPASREEARYVASVCRPATLLLGEDASQQKLTQLASNGELSRFGLIHLAAHSLVDDDQPGRSALVLSQVNLPNALDSAAAGRRIYDGLLRVEQIVHEWKLNADLVTLSGCETALGRAAGGEGYVGLAQAFLRAGANSVVVSLWKVNDRATSLLMRRFYENRAGIHGRLMPKAEALQESKLWLRSYVEPEGTRPYEHPYYWAGFILIGDAGDRRSLSKQPSSLGPEALH